MTMKRNRIRRAAFRASMIGLSIHAATGIAEAGCNSEAYIGELCLTATNFCPRGTLSADGQALPIANYQALFSLLGTMYGGDGRTTFKLPDLREQAPVSAEGNQPKLRYCVVVEGYYPPRG